MTDEVCPFASFGLVRKTPGNVLDVLARLLLPMIAPEKGGCKAQRTAARNRVYQELIDRNGLVGDLDLREKKKIYRHVSDKVEKYQHLREGGGEGVILPGSRAERRRVDNFIRLKEDVGVGYRCAAVISDKIWSYMCAQLK
jgi:hypothetical protein